MPAPFYSSKGRRRRPKRDRSRGPKSSRPVKGFYSDSRPGSRLLERPPGGGAATIRFVVASHESFTVSLPVDVAIAVFRAIASHAVAVLGRAVRLIAAPSRPVFLTSADSVVVPVLL